MSQQLADNLDLTLSWRRAKFDRPDRCFLTHPFLIDLIELDLDDWLGELKDRLVQGYAPSPAQTCREPKGGGLVRPGTHITLQDEVVFNAVVGTVFRNLAAILRWSQGNPDIAYQLAISHENPEWVSRGFVVWKQFREKSLGYIEKGAGFILFADISAFYENIDLPRLASDLRRVGIDGEAMTLLSACMNRWAEPRGKGIPQGYSAADILAKLYLEPLDQNLRNEGFTHLRYVDDIRVFCGTENEAKLALLNLSELLRLRGLNLQSAKTYIRRADEARIEIDGVAPVIKTIQEELQDELFSEYAIAGSAASLSDLERLVNMHPDHPPVNVLERAFYHHFLNAPEHDFHKTLFHFLLTRLAQVGSNAAVDFALDTLRRRPEETKVALRYLEKIGIQGEEEGRLLDLLLSPDAIYDYQNYLILKYFWDRGRFPSNLIQLIRRLCRNRNLPAWLRSYAVALLGEAGDSGDLEFLEASYPNCADELERSEIVCALRRMEMVRRNGFIGRTRTDGTLVRRAANWVQAQSA